MQKQRTQLLGSLAQEFTQFNGLSASFFRAVAARIGVTVTDMQVIEGLASAGPMTAGQLAELTGLTTGAITGMLNRLEEAGLVRRERDPEDGRKVIVQLNSDAAQIRGIGAIFTSIQKVWEEQTAHYDDEQVAFLVDFLKRANAVAKQEILWLREPPLAADGIHSAPLGDLASARLVFPNGGASLTLRANGEIATLYQARFEGAVPEVKVKDGVVTVRYPRRLWVLGMGQGVAEIALNTAIPWSILIQGGASMIIAELAGLNLTGLEFKGGASSIRVTLPVPSSMVPVQITGGASIITVLRPAGIPVRAHLKGWATAFALDDQTFNNIGNDARLQSPNYDPTAPGYDIDIASSTSMVSISTT